MGTFIPQDNWLLVRSAGALFNLQKTPYDKTVNTIEANPKKTQNSATVSHSREYLTNWPADTVFKIASSNGTSSINKLELETTSTWSQAIAEAGDSLAIWDALYFASGASPIFDSVKWSGGNNEGYDSVEVATNVYNPYYDALGNLVPAWDITTYTSLWDTDGLAYMTNVVTVTQQLSPNTLGTGAVPCTLNGGGTYFFADPLNSVWAKFSGITNAKDFADEYVKNSGSVSTAAFCMRIDADSAHTLTPYVRGVTYSNHGRFGSSAIGAGYTNNIFSYRHTTSDKAMGFVQKHDTTCKWYYTPDACEDCWYEGKVIKVRVAYKKAAITYSYVTSDSPYGYFYNTWTIGSFASHSTVDYDLTIPAGYTRQQLGSTFTVPTVDGYIVAIDDIKFISVT